MARTGKSIEGKVMRERAREAGDKKMEKLKKLRQENRERAKHISGRKNKQLKTIRDEKIGKAEKDPKRDASPKEIQKYQKGADLLISRVPFKG